MKIELLVASLVVAALTACGNNNVPQLPVDAQQHPVQQQADGFDTGDAAVGALAGAAAGYMMGKSSNNSHPRTVIVDRRPTYYGYNDYKRGTSVTRTTTTVKKSMFGNKRTVTRTTTSRRR